MDAALYDLSAGQMRRSRGRTSCREEKLRREKILEHRYCSAEELTQYVAGGSKKGKRRGRP
jgi:hypothetical protein